MIGIIGSRYAPYGNSCLQSKMNQQTLGTRTHAVKNAEERCSGKPDGMLKRAASGTDKAV